MQRIGAGSPSGITGLLTVLLGTLPVWGQAQLPTELLLLTRARRHMAAELARITNYTCLETVERLRQAKPSAGLKRQDTVRFEVAHVGGKEWFAPPDAPAFEEREPAALIGGGMMGSGLFASFARSVFLGDQTTFQYRGEQLWNGRRVVRYDYRLGALDRDWQVQVGGASGNVSTRGMIWLDPRSLDLVRLEADADDIPPHLPVEAIRASIEYAREDVGATPALLAQSGELRMRLPDGTENVNRVEFTHCRAFQSESTVSFGPMPPPQGQGPLLGAIVQAAAGVAPVSLPAGVVMRLALTRPVDSAAAGTGDLIQARIAADVRVKGAGLIPAGTRVSGRVRRLEYYTDPQPYWVVGLEFDEIERTGGPIRFFADLARVDHPPAGLQWLLGFSHESSYTLSDGTRVFHARSEKITVTDLPGVGTFFVEGRHCVLPAGMQMLWKTRALR